MGKKSFTGDNPALQFITMQVEQEQGQDQQRNLAETKSKRVNLLIYPSLHESMVKIARVRGISFNELVNAVLYAYEQDNQQDIEKYNEIWGTKQ